MSVCVFVCFLMMGCTPHSLYCCNSYFTYYAILEKKKTVWTGYFPPLSLPSQQVCHAKATTISRSNKTKKIKNILFLFLSFCLFFFLLKKNKKKNIWFMLSVFLVLLTFVPLLSRSTKSILFFVFFNFFDFALLQRKNVSTVLLCQILLKSGPCHRLPLYKWFVIVHWKPPTNNNTPTLSQSTIEQPRQKQQNWRKEFKVYIEK